MVKRAPFVANDKKCLFGLREVHFAQPHGAILNGIRKKISDLGRAAAGELGKGYRTPEGLWEWLLERNDVIMDDEQGLKDGELIKALRAGNVMNHYQFKGEIISQTMTMELTGRLERDGVGLEFREHLPAYMRTIDRKLENDFNESTRWGMQIHMIIHG